MDPRITRLADLLVNYSTAAKPGENLLVETIGTDALDLVEEIVRVAAEGGVNVQYNIHHQTVLRAFLHAAKEEQVAALTDAALHQMKQMDCYIGVRGASNASELADVPAEAMRWYSKHYFEAVHLKERVAKTRWVVLRYPNDAMSQLARKPKRAFEDFYFDVCTMDYAKMSEAMDALVELMANTDRVKVVGRNTELSLSIKGLRPIKCDGKVNIPDGEVYTAPVKDSIDGRVCFNAGSMFESKAFGPITLEFEAGKCVKVEAGGDTEAVEAILDRDEGARYVGEFALGVNPYITSPMLDTLFDEKIGGSLHMAMGNSYDDCFNGNRSGIHWDLVHIQTPEWGGGEIWFDGVLVRKDGVFVHEALLPLNPDALKG